MEKMNLGITGLSGNLGRNNRIEESYWGSPQEWMLPHPPLPPTPPPKKGGNSLSRFSLLVSFL